MSSPAEGKLSAPPVAPASRTSGGEHFAVALDGVTKRFGKTTALDDVSLMVRRGELMTLLGPSGCGKTTLLNLVAGFLIPDSGEIAIAGRRMTDVPAYRREIGIMFQNYALFPHMSVAANVGYGLRMRRIAKAEIARRVGEALALVKLAGLEDRKPRQEYRLASPDIGFRTNKHGHGHHDGLRGYDAVLHPVGWRRDQRERDMRYSGPSKTGEKSRGGLEPPPCYPCKASGGTYPYFTE